MVLGSMTNIYNIFIYITGGHVSMTTFSTD